LTHPKDATREKEEEEKVRRGGRERKKREKKRAQAREASELMPCCARAGVELIGV
jgi:hypothetical protein